MQDSMYASPYRNRGAQPKKEYKISKFLRRTIKKVIFTLIVFCALYSICRVELITSSSLWQKALEVFGDDINYEEAKTTLSEAVVFVKEKFPEYFGEGNTIDEDTQMQIDVKSILEKTTVIRPVAGVATQRFERKNGEIVHGGVDLAAEIGTPVKAAIGGKVIKVEKLEGSFGTYVKIQNDNIITTYAHCSTIEVTEGDIVEQGAVIAYSGNTGKSLGPHLHFEVSIDDRLVDPGFLLTYN